MDLLTVPTPRAFIDRPRLLKNIALMQTVATGAGVRLRPHAKTHKSPVIAKMQIDAGAVGVCCAKLGEAEVLADAGIRDIRLPYPINPVNAARVVGLLDRGVRLSIIVDNADVASAWSAAMVAARRTLDVLVKVDVGFHRCGVNPDSPTVIDDIRGISESSGLRFLGLLSHAGQGYGAESQEELEAIAQREAEILGSIAARLRDAGVEVAEISVGATPTARFITRQHGVTEMRPGNYVFFDRTQVGLGAATVDDCALWIVATVVSRPAATRVVFDAGSKTLTNDGLRGFGTHVGHGLVCRDLSTTVPDASIVIERLSEEHAVARVPADCTLRIGDRVRILPNHSCVVSNLMDELLVVEGTTVVETLPVAARGRIW
ncbi:MAG TPA: alanine racemase [Vicinamibacterales bacterium]|nr:alanine racemase [Vicinamibacterales bacterium]